MQSADAGPGAAHTILSDRTAHTTPQELPPLVEATLEVLQLELSSLRGGGGGGGSGIGGDGGGVATGSGAAGGGAAGGGFGGRYDGTLSPSSRMALA